MSCIAPILIYSHSVALRLKPLGGEQLGTPLSMNVN
jgi:hypothetical protein